MPTREEFEAAIIDNPDEKATYSAYADWLQEQGDPRGEFIAVQLALEDESRPKEEREALKEREKELLAAHEREWLGELAPFVLDSADPEKPLLVMGWSWHRGVLVELDTQCLTIDLAQAVAASSATRLTRELRVRGPASYHSHEGEGTPRVSIPDGFAQRYPDSWVRHYEYFELIGSPPLNAVRVFRTGDDEDEPPENRWTDCHCHVPGIEHVIAAMPRVEELHLFCNDYDLAGLLALGNLTHLRVLRAYHVGGRERNGRRYEYALDILAANPAFANLTHLQFHPHFAEEGYEGTERSYLPLGQVRHLLRSPHLKKLTHLQLRLSDMGDDGIREIIASGILKQLKWLDLRHGCVTDEGARLLTACPDAKRLERLDLSRNAVTAAGLAALRAAKVNAVANNPLTQTELDQREYLREGDFE